MDGTEIYNLRVSSAPSYIDSLRCIGRVSGAQVVVIWRISEADQF
jgi:hypothetical protein